MKIEIKIFFDYMYVAYDFGKTKFCFDEELSESEFQFRYLTRRFQKIYKDELVRM
jgi:hypothetical protein